MPPRKTVQPNAPATPKKLGGVTGKGFMPGRSGNPGGNAKGLSAIVRQMTRNGATIYDRLWLLTSQKDDPRVQLDALKLLAAYGFGTPGTAQVEWDEARVRALATSQGRDPDDAVKTFRAIQGGKASA